MKKEDIIAQRHALLAAVEKEFADALIAAEISPAVDEDNPKGRMPKPEVLNVLMRGLAQDGSDVLGEFFFAPTGPEDSVQIFNNVLTLREDIKPDEVDDVLACAAILNTLIPVGAFGVNMFDKSLIYRHAYELPHPVSDEVLKDSIDLCMGTAVEVVQRFGYIILEVAQKTRSVESVMGLIGV